MEEKIEETAVGDEKTEANVVVITARNRIILLNPITWEKVEYKEFVFNVDELTGRDLIEIQTDMKLEGIPLVSSMRIDSAYMALVAAKSAKVDVEVIKSLKATDFSRVMDKVSGLMPW